MQDRSKWGTYERKDNVKYGRTQTHTLENPNLFGILLRKTFIDPATNCWMWTGAKNKKGYGHVRLDFKTVNLNRIAGILFLKLDKEDSNTHVLHKCPNKACWNPEHLYLGNNVDNWKDRKTGPTMGIPTNKEDE